MAGVTLVVGLGVLEDETVGALQAVGALLYAVGTVFKVAASHALVRALGQGERERKGGRERLRERERVRRTKKRGRVRRSLVVEFEKLKNFDQAAV